MHLDDATAFIIDFARQPRPSGYASYASYGYEIYLPNVIRAYLSEVERVPAHGLADNQRSRDLSPVFYEAAWNLCRRGVLRPSIANSGGQATADGASGNGYSLTQAGRRWIAADFPLVFLADAGRLDELFKKLSQRLGPGFQQRASEAVLCHRFGINLACCAMCGAAAESILLAVATAKASDEAAVLAVYRSATGRHRVIESIVGKAKQAISGPFRAATGLLSYWRDEAAHGTPSEISEIEAHEAVARLVRFAQFTVDNWDELVS